MKVLLWTLVGLGVAGIGLLSALAVAPFSAITAAAMSFYVLGCSIAAGFVLLTLIRFVFAPRLALARLRECAKNRLTVVWACCGLLMAAVAMLGAFSALPVDGEMVLVGMVAIEGLALVLSAAWLLLEVRNRKRA